MIGIIIKKSSFLKNICNYSRYKNRLEIVYLCSTPWSRTVSIGALVILLVLVFEWEHTDSVVLGHAWVGDSAARLGSGEVERVCLAGSESEGENDEASHDDELWRCSTQN